MENVLSRFDEIVLKCSFDCVDLVEVLRNDHRTRIEVAFFESVFSDLILTRNHFDYGALNALFGIIMLQAFFDQLGISQAKVSHSFAHEQFLTLEEIFFSDVIETVEHDKLEIRNSQTQHKYHGVL